MHIFSPFSQLLPSPLTLVKTRPCHPVTLSTVWTTISGHNVIVVHKRTDMSVQKVVCCVNVSQNIPLLLNRQQPT